MAYAIPNPLPIVCSVCKQQMQVHHQAHQYYIDCTVVAAECRCGRVIGAVSGRTIARSCHLAPGGAQLVPLTEKDIDTSEDVGKHAVEDIQRAQAAISEADQVIAAATWAKAKPRSKP